MFKKKEFLIILIIQITEVLGFSLILPFLPFFAEDLGASPLTVGLILTSFSFFQFLSAPIMGRLSDHYGRRPMLIFSQISTLIGFLILAFANSLPLIFLSRIVDGLLGSNFTIAQAYLADISSDEERSQAFGVSGIAFGVGFLIGPAIGGSLARSGYSLPSFLAAGLSLLTIVITFLFLPETVKKRTEKIKVKIIDWGVFQKYWRDPNLKLKLAQFFTFLLAMSLWTSTFALYARAQIKINTQQVGFILAYIGLLSIILRGPLLGKLIKIFSEEKLRMAGMILIIFGLTGSIWIRSLHLLVIVMTFFATGVGLARPLLVGQISRQVSRNEQGAILGLTSSLASLSQIFGPLLGGAALNHFFPGFLGLLGALTMGGGLTLSLLEKKRLIKT